MICQEKNYGDCGFEKQKNNPLPLIPHLLTMICPMHSENEAGVEFLNSFSTTLVPVIV